MSSRGKSQHVAYIILLVCSSCLPTLADWFNSSFVPSTNILINCGSAGTVVGQDNRTWEGDIGSGFLQEFNTSDVAGGANNTAAPIPWSSVRIFTRNITYRIPVLPGIYFVRLYFRRGEYRQLVGQRPVLFRVQIGSDVLVPGSFDGDLNHQYLVKEFPVNATSPTGLELSFLLDFRYGDFPYGYINGIEIVSLPEDNLELPKYYSNNLPWETIYRLNIGGSRVSPREDSGLFREWTPDSMFLTSRGLVSSIKADNVTTIHYTRYVPEYTAPIPVYRTQRSVTGLNNSLTWSLPVDPSFIYSVRLHICRIGTRPNKIQFNLYITNLNPVDVIKLTDSSGNPTYRDYTVRMGQEFGTLIVRLEPIAVDVDAALNGLEVFKLIGSTPPQAIPLENTGRERDNTHVAKVVGGAIGGSFAVVSIICLIMFRLIGSSSKEKKSGVKASKMAWFQTDATTTTRSRISSVRTENSCRHFSYTEIKDATEAFSDKLLLGSGGFGKVYCGSIKDSNRCRKVAIKRAKPMSNQGVHEFTTEIEMLSKLRHRHLVSLIGFCEEAGEMILVYDYIAYGTLRQHLYKTNNPPLTWKQRLMICIGAARGLHYLHTGAKNPIIHRDVKSTNILLDVNWVAKVADFGLSKTSPQLDDVTHVSTAVKGTFGYIDPEYFQCQQLTNKSDVYSFGVVLFEVLCARSAIDPKLPTEQVSLVNWVKDCHKNGTLQDIIDPYLQGHIAAEVFERFVEVARKCLANRGANRPTMGEVLSSLEIILRLQNDIDSCERLGTSVACEEDDSNALLTIDSNELNHMSNCSNATISATNGESLAR